MIKRNQNTMMGSEATLSPATKRRQLQPLKSRTVSTSNATPLQQRSPAATPVNESGKNLQSRYQKLMSFSYTQ